MAFWQGAREPLKVWRNGLLFASLLGSGLIGPGATAFSQDSPLAPGAGIDGIQYADIDGSGIPVAVITSSRRSSEDQTELFLDILGRDGATGQWNQFYHYSLEVGRTASATPLIGSLTGDGTQQVVYPWVGETGGPLSYLVLGYSGDAVTTLLARRDVPSGDVAIVNNVLMEYSGDVARRFRWDGSIFVMEPALPDAYPGATVISYTAAPGSVTQSRVSVPLGTILQLRREDPGQEPSRVVVVNPSAAASSPGADVTAVLSRFGWQLYEAIGVGQGQIRIIPAGGNESSALTITVQVTPSDGRPPFNPF